MSKLVERMKQYEIPPIPYLPGGKNVLVYRIPTETKTAGGLFIPEEHREADCRAVVLAAGLGARDIMRDHLQEIGDIVWIARFAGYEKGIERDRSAGEAGKKFLQLKADDILGTEDGWARFNSDYEVAYDEDTGEHYYARKGTK